MHQLPQKFSNQTRPFISCGLKTLDGSSRRGNWNGGAALFISGEGTSCGSRRSPIARKATSAMNSTSGIKRNLFIDYSTVEVAAVVAIFGICFGLSRVDSGACFLE